MKTRRPRRVFERGGHDEGVPSPEYSLHCRKLLLTIPHEDPRLGNRGARSRCCAFARHLLKQEATGRFAAGAIPAAIGFAPSRVGLFRRFALASRALGLAAVGLAENPLAQAERFRRGFDEFVGRDILDGLLE